MIDTSKIKLVIWDLDDTFWKGTLSEGPIESISSNIQLVKDLTDRGIVNTICSKNDYEPTVNKLQELGIDDFFVFKSIDWTPKGQRISQLIKDMGLRPVNCLFLDDNVVNLNEAKFYSKELMIGEPSDISHLLDFCSSTDATDIKHKRLNQYKVLEEKQKAKAEAGDNLQFLYASNTTVEIHKDCKKVSDRLFELINRTNQLNFTKNRCSREEFDATLDDNDVNNGYVTVKDNFGDYGIVGFFSVKNNKCIHFLFSCRTIGQGVEQWVYSTLGCPELNIVGEVVNKVENIEAPAWINQEKNEDSRPDSIEKTNLKLVFKGACDLSIMSSFLNSNNIIEEFTYISDKKIGIEHHNHSVNYLSLPFLTKEEQDVLLSECIFNDEGIFKTHMYDDDVAIVFLSTQIEPNLGIYKKKGSELRFAYSEYTSPMTDKGSWDEYVNDRLYNVDFSYDWLEWFSSNYDFIGRLTPQDVADNVKLTLQKVGPKTKVCLILGSETPYLANTQKAYKDRHIFYKEVNHLLLKMAEVEPRLLLINVNDYIRSQNDFTNNINHFKRDIYYKMAQKANEYIYNTTNRSVVQSAFQYEFNTILKSVKDKFIQNLRKIYHGIKKTGCK